MLLIDLRCQLLNIIQVDCLAMPCSSLEDFVTSDDGGHKGSYVAEYCWEKLSWLSADLTLDLQTCLFLQNFVHQILKCPFCFMVIAIMTTDYESYIGDGR